MRRILAVATITVGIGVLGTQVAAQDTKTARGVVSATAPDAVTVKVGSNEMTFKIDSATRVGARGGSTAMREARAEGKTGLPYTDFVKVGQTVEVTYHEAGMHAATIHVVAGGATPSKTTAAPPAPTVAPAAQAPRTSQAVGIVTAVSNTALTIKAGSDELAFAVDGKTTVVGRGLGTQAREMKSTGERAVFSEFVHKGDNVQVRYEETSGTKRASEVHVTRK
jgi:hypothetical protein